MISEADKDYIVLTLTSWIAPLEKPREALTSAFIGTTFPEQLGQGTPGLLVMEAVRLALVDGWSHNPPWLALLLQLLPQDEKIAVIQGQLRHPPPPAPDPLDTTILTTGAPFIGRARLRQRLRFLESPAAKLQPILVVNGKPKIGKTYSTQYIDHFSYHRPTTYCYRIEFDPEVGLETGPEQLASDLVSQMGRPVNTMPLPNTNQKLHIRYLASWVLNEAVQTPARHWFILDNFRGEKLRPDTRDFLVVLSDRLTTGVFPQACRLILIGFDRAQLTVDPNKVEEESIQPCTPVEIQAAIGEILKRAPAVVNADRINSLIVDDLPNDQGKMIELNTRLRALLYAVQEVGQILQGVPGADYEDVLLEMLVNLPNDRERMAVLQSRLEDLRSSAVEVAGG